MSLINQTQNAIQSISNKSLKSIISNQFLTRETTVQFIEYFKESPSLLSLLINKRDKLRLIVETAIKTDNSAAVAYFLIPFVKHNDIYLPINQQLFDKARSASKNKVRDYVESAPLLDAILRSKPNDIEFLIKLQALINDFPDILKIRWAGEGQTILHLATIYNASSIVSLLLNAGANQNAVDNQTMTSLDYSIAHQHHDIALIFTQNPSTELVINRENYNTPFIAILETNNARLIEAAIKTIEMQGVQKEHEQYYERVIDALTIDNQEENDYWRFKEDKIQLAPIFDNADYSNFATVLKTPGRVGELQGFFDDYCSQYHQWTGQLLILHTKLFNVLSFDSWINCFKSIIALKGELATTLYHQELINTTHAQLIIFLFSIPLDKLPMLVIYLEPCDLKFIQNLLCQAMKHPGIYSRLTTAQHQSLTEILLPKKTTELINYYFQTIDLSLLQPSTIQFYIHITEGTFLLKHNKNRLNLILLIATLNRALTEDQLFDSESINELLAKIPQELSIFNQDTISYSSLFIALNLATNTLLKQNIQNYLMQQPDDSFINQRIIELFKSFNSQYSMNQDSVYADLFLMFSKKTFLYPAIQSSNGISEFLTTLTPDKFIDVLTNYNLRTHPVILINSLQQPVNTTIVNLDVKRSLIKQLYLLDEMTQRINLSPSITATDEIVQQIVLISSVLQSYNPLLHDKLQALSRIFCELLSNLEKIQNGESLFSFQGTEYVIEQIIRENHQLTSLFDSENSLFGYDAIDPILFNRINRLLKHRIPNFVVQMNAKFNSRTQLQQNNDMLLNEAMDNVSFAPLLALYRAQAIDNDSDISHLINDYSIKMTSDIQILSSLVSSGFENSVYINELLPVLIQWQMEHGYACIEEQLYNNIAIALSRCTKETLQGVVSQQELILNYEREATPLLTRLNQLKTHKVTLPILIDCLSSASKHCLSNFMGLALQIKLDGFYRLSYFAQSVKTHALTNTDFIFQEIEHNIDSWLKENLAQITRYTSISRAIQALSLGLFLNEEQCLSRLNDLYETLIHQNAPLTNQAIVHLAYSYCPILNSADNEIVVLLIQVFNELFLAIDYCQKVSLLKEMPLDFIQKMIEFCLMGCASIESDYALTCKALLMQLCNNLLDSKSVNAIKDQLGSQALDCLKTQTLRQLAEHVLLDPHSLNDMTLNGVWIQRLLLSPTFVAQSTPQILAQLIERYRALSVTLKQDEYFRLNEFLTEKLEFNNEKWERLQQQLLHNPASKERLLVKREQLLTFRADDGIRALLNQLEENCHSLQKSAGTEAEQALSVLYNYLNTQLQTLRSDFIFKTADYFYSKALQGKGDISTNRLICFVKKYMPHSNFVQGELNRKTHYTLYDNLGHKIGFINEQLDAITLKKGQPKRLIDSGYHSGFIVYDNNRIRIGVLNSSGQINYDNLFSQNTSAQLIRKIPMTALVGSQPIYDLLFMDILHNQAVDTLYEGKEYEEDKKSWIDNQILRQVQISKQYIPVMTQQHIAEHASFDAITNILTRCANQDNALHLFLSLIENDEQRSYVLEARNQSRLLLLLDNIYSTALFTEFLIRFYNKPWFPRVLELFGNYAKHINSPIILTQALAQISKDKLHQHISASVYDELLQTLLNHEHTAFIIISCFMPNQNTEHTERFSRFFYRYHLIPVMEYLNQQMSWYGSAQYKLLLIILDAEREWLFPRREPRHSKKYGFRETDIKTIRHFIGRHIHTADNHDPDNRLGRLILNELVFRAAHYGYTGFFYNRYDQLDLLVMHYKLSRDSYIQQQSVIKKFFDTHTKNHLTTNWNGLAEESFEAINNELYLMTAFLLNYAGSTTELMLLLENTLNSPAINDQNFVNQLSDLISKFPNREVSKLVFLALERAAVGNPKIISESVLTNLIAFYNGTQNKAEHCNNRAENVNPGALLTHFANQKYYALTIHCADLMIQNSHSRIQTKQIQSIRKIAVIENELQNHLSSWFFFIIKFVKRLWHYGFGGFYKNNGIVTYCDSEPKNENNPIQLSDEIKTTMTKGQEVDNAAPEVQKRIIRQQLGEATAKMEFYQKRLAVLKNNSDSPQVKISSNGFFRTNQITVLQQDNDSDTEYGYI